VIGGIAWVALFVFAGYFFGNIPFVKDNLKFIVVLIIIISLIPMLLEYIKHKKEKAGLTKGIP
jgi:membrane-associated protein